LLNALVETCLEDLDHRIVVQMAKDKAPNGRFARAYLAVCANSQNRSDNVRWDNLAALLMSDVSMRSRWSTWATHRLEEHKATDDKFSSVVVRLAADGLWLSDVAGSPGLPQAKRKQLIAHLIKLTRQAE